MSLDETNVQLLHNGVWRQFEADGRRTFQRGVEVLQQRHLQSTTSYKGLCEEQDRELSRLREEIGSVREEIGSLREEIGSLREDNRLCDEIARNQKQLIGMYESQLQQQPAVHLAQGGPLLPQYNEPSRYSPYQQPPRSNNFIIDPASLRPLGEFDYSIGAPIEPPCDIGPAMSAPFPQFEDQTSNLSMQAGVHPTSAERDVPGPGCDKSEETKRGEDDVARPNKKRKTK